MSGNPNKREVVEARRRRVLELVSVGVDRFMIQRELGVSMQTINRDVSAVHLMLRPQFENRGKEIAQEFAIQFERRMRELFSIYVDQRNGYSKKSGVFVDPNNHEATRTLAEMNRAHAEYLRLMQSVGFVPRVADQMKIETEQKHIILSWKRLEDPNEERVVIESKD